MNIFKKILLILNVIWLIVLFDVKTFTLLWDLSWYLLLIIVYSRPLSNIFNKLIFLKRIVSIRKELWILCATLWIAHVIWYFLNLNNLWLIFNSFYWRPDNAFGYWIYAFIISIPLLLTSNIYSMKLLGKNWKRLQRLTYLFFIFIAIHIMLIKPEDSTWPKVAVIVWLILWVIAFIKQKKLTNQ